LAGGCFHASSNEVFMHTAYRIALATCACAWLLPAADALAQSAGQPPAADPGASVPATTYRPAIGYRPEAAPEASPDRNWIESNATVAAYNSMSLTMKMKGMRAPAAPAPADPHAAHAGHAGHGGPAQHADAEAAASTARPAAPSAESP
jgi:hypothetical protein